jgi:hypothetical protein
MVEEPIVTVCARAVFADVAISNTVVPAKSSFFTFVSSEIHPTSVEWDTSVP